MPSSNDFDFSPKIRPDKLRPRRSRWFGCCGQRGAFQPAPLVRQRALPEPSQTTPSCDIRFQLDGFSPGQRCNPAVTVHPKQPSLSAAAPGRCAAICRPRTRRCRICGSSRRGCWRRGCWRQCALTVAPVPDGALTDFVPHRHPGYLDAFAAAGDVTRVSALLGSCVSCWVDGTGCVAGRVRNAGSAGVTVENGASRPTDRRTGRGLGSREFAAGGASRVVAAV